MFANLNENPRKSGLFGGKSLWKMPGRNRFGEELKILDFAWGELTLDDTMLHYKACKS